MSIKVESGHDNDKIIKDIKDYFILMHSKVHADECLIVYSTYGSTKATYFIV